MPKRYFLCLIFLLTILSAQPVSAETPNFEILPKLARNLTLAEYNLQASVEPMIGISRDRLNFGAEIGGTSTSPQTIIISNNGNGRLAWAATVSGSWLSAAPLTGSEGSIVSTAADPTGLAAGTYHGSITFTSFTAANAPVVLPISLTVYDTGGTASPFGTFETPTDWSTVSGSIPVTGWTLDDIEVTSLEIYRDPVIGEGSGLVYIGDALLVEGARPDVEVVYPDYPNNDKAGWGFTLLTNSLPNDGNGTYTLYAISIDSSGNTVTLGSKTITADNANAVKPFGDIDTPSQGGAAAGTSFVNFCWALTPLPNMIPTDGSTIDIYVDGINLGHPNYNNYRADIATLFPGYANSDGAVGYFNLDTTAYENGVHTIQWVVTDDAGNTDGIGSRYFTILNPVPAPVFVDDDYDATTPGWGSDHFDSIQDGIDQVTVGGVVDVAAGTYAETVTLGKDVYVSLSGNVDISGDLSISSGNFVSSGENLNLSGNLSITGGDFNPNDGTVNFNGSGTQTITGDTIFFDLIVGNGVVVSTAANITVDGTLTNNGITRETKTIAGTGAYAFGLADVSVDVTSAGLTSLQVERRDQDHPSANAGIHTGKYWGFTPVGSGFTLDMTLPHNIVPDEFDKVCRYTGVDTTWNCASDSFDPTENTITRQGVTQLSDWATGNNVGPTALTMVNIKTRSGWGANFIDLALSGLFIISIGSIIVLALLWVRKRTRISNYE